MSTDLQKVKEFWEKCKKSKEDYADSKYVPYYSVKDYGDFEVRILQVYNIIVGEHRGILRKGTVSCPRIWDGSTCPVCQLVEVLSNSKEKADKDQAKRWSVKKKYPLLILDLEDSEFTKPKIYMAPWTIYNKTMG